MPASFGTAIISLGSVVLDRPDQTGLYIAKDIAGGWAYLVTDADGDSRLRGHGVCEGGLEVALRCAFLSAINRVPDSRRIRILVDSRQAHRTMAQLARDDLRVARAIAERPAAIMTRPLERSSYQVRAAAERAASVALLSRERDERFFAGRPEAGELAGGLGDVGVVKAPDAFRHSSPGEAGPAPAAMRPVEDPRKIARNWRARAEEESGRSETDARENSFAIVRRLVRPFMEGARHGLTAAGMLSPPNPQRRALAPRDKLSIDWLGDFETRVAGIHAELRDMGA